MKAIKKTDENLVKVAKDICSVSFSSGFFFSKDSFRVLDHHIVIYSDRFSIGKSILSIIPCNFSFRVIFVNSNSLRLDIWYEKR